MKNFSKGFESDETRNEDRWEGLRLGVTRDFARGTQHIKLFSDYIVHRGEYQLEEFFRGDEWA